MATGSGRQHSVRNLVVIMAVVVIAGILIARSYYGKINRSLDPRVVQARELYGEYDVYARTGDYHAIFVLLDSIEQIFNATDHYRESFELGVLDNNRAAAMLTIALYRDSIPEAADPFAAITTDSLVSRAAFHIYRAIETYEGWNLKYAERSQEEIRQMIEPAFLSGLETYSQELKDDFMETRIREIELALGENNRRLSVCHSNLGLVFRYRGEYESAVSQYEKALELWDRNLDAENNLNRLLDRPLRKRNIIQRLFPPEKDQ